MSVPHYKWNMACHFLDGVFFFAAMITLSAEVVMPALISELTDKDFLVGLRLTIMHAGMLVPQLFYAKRIEGLSYKKPTVLFCVVLERVGWLVFLVTLFVRWSPTFTLCAFFSVLAVNSLGTGLSIPIWTDWYSKTVPEHLWARLLGIRRAVPAVLGLALGKAIQMIMQSYPSPQRYRILVSLALVFYALSFVCIALVREERHEGLPSQRGATWRSYFSGLLTILWRRRDFRAFLGAVLLVGLPATVMVAYLAKYGTGLPGSYEGIGGIFTMHFFGWSAAGSLIGGAISDRKGVMAPFRIYPLFIAGAAALAFVAVSPGWVSAAWALLGFGIGISMTAILPAIFRFAGPHRRPSYLAIQFTVFGTLAAVVVPALGLLMDAEWLTYGHVFAGCTVLALLGWLVLLGRPAPEPHPVQEPAA